MAKLNRTSFSIKFKQGLAANINATATKYLAETGEPHYATDTKELYIFDGTTNNLVGSITVATKAAILALTTTAGKIGFSSDTLELWMADGSTWRKIPFALVPDTSSPDMGYLQDSSRIGYGTTYVTDKTLNNTVIGSNGTASTGGVRVTTAGVFQVYLNGSWNTVVTNFILREDATFGYTFEHMPVGFTQYLEIMTGQSLSNLGLNGLPITNAYKTSMGAYPAPAVIGGRSIT